MSGASFNTQKDLFYIKQAAVTVPQPLQNFTAFPNFAFAGTDINQFGGVIVDMLALDANFPSEANSVYVNGYCGAVKGQGANGEIISAGVGILALQDDDLQFSFGANWNAITLADRHSRDENTFGTWVSLNNTKKFAYFLIADYFTRTNNSNFVNINVTAYAKGDVL